MKRKLFLVAAGAVGGLFLFAGPAGAQDDSLSAEMVQAVMDNLWVFIAGVLVFLMQAGFAMLESGLTRSKNVANIMAKNLADASIGILAFFLVGYGLAYGGDGNSAFGWGSFALSGIDLFDISEGLSGSTDFFFQAVFAATAVTIASGAMAERTKFSTYLIFSLVTTAIIYPIVVHWTWGGGLIASISIGDAVYSDFAGSTIVHSVGGWIALVGAWMLGPRIGKYAADGTSRTIPGHNVTLAILGVFILWFGWFGFNPGSELAADEFVMFVALNTVLAACAGVIGATALNWLRTGRPDVPMAGNGALAGLVGITAGCGTMTPWGAIITGFVAGLSRKTVRRNVTINGLLPGPFDTDRLNGTFAARAKATGRPAEELRSEGAAANPAGRFGTAEEFGHACAFLCSAHAGFITGQNLLMDGGSFPGTL